MQSRASRVARGWIAGSFATGVAALSHGLADGAAPSPLSVGTALVFAGLLGTLVLGRRPSLPRLTIVVAGSQVAFHLVFSWLTPATGTGTGTAHHGTAHHGTAAVLEPAVAHHGTDPVMWFAHAVALLATLAFLRRAEVALWQLLTQTLAEAIATVTRVPAIVARPPRLRTSSASAPRHPVLSFLEFVVSHRGPPAAALAH